jgi:threonine dehydratase
VIRPTPTFFSPFFSAESGNRVFIKPENLQVTGSFKIRGAYNRIAQLTSDEREKGLIAASAGNHAQGVASAAKALDVKATIVMPTVTPLIKVEATRNFGAEVVLAGQNYDEAYQAALVLQKQEGYIFIHPFNDRQVMAGQGTIGLEILDELSDVEVILVPVGGGGLAGGIAAAVKQIAPKVQIIGVEPSGAASMQDSLHAGQPVRLERVDTIADGVAVSMPGELTYAAVHALVDDMITVTDGELTDAFLMLLEKHKLIAEASGVLPLAAVKHMTGKGKNVLALISGGNIDVMTIASMIQSGLVSRGRIFCFSLELPDVPGELLKLCQILAEERANIVQVVHDQFKAADSLKRVNLEATVETHGHDHRRRIVEALNRKGYQVRQVY